MSQQSLTKSYLKASQQNMTASGPAPKTSLLPWQLAFAEWLANHDKRPLLSEQHAKAIELATASNDGEPVNVPLTLVRSLKMRPDFKKYIEKYLKDVLKTTRTKIERRVPKYVDAHYKALEMALENDDYKAIASITEPVMERVWPKREIAQVNTQINIQLGPKQQELLDVPEASFEVLEADVVHDESTIG